MTTSARQPKGIPVGGQFAATTHTEPSLTLGAPNVAPEYVGHRLDELRLAEHFNLKQIDEIASRLNASKDFSDKNIHTVADETHLKAHGYTATAARDAEEGLRVLRENGHNGNAEALETVIDAKLANARRAANETGSHYAEPIPDGKEIPVPHDDPRVQAGEVFDRVLAEDGVFVHSSVSGYPQDTQAIRFQANRPLTDAEAYALSGVVGYANSSAIGGEACDNPAYGPSRDTPYSFIAHIDTNKGRQGDFGKFEAMIPDMIANGSPLRKTKDNTRAIEPFGDPDLKLEIFYRE